MTRRIIWQALAASVLLIGSASPSLPHSFLENHCYECHDDSTQKGGVDFSQLGDDLIDPATFHLWERVHDRVLAGEMPPPDKDQPSAASKAGLLEKLSQDLTTAHAAQKGKGLRRLNRKEYQNTLNDMFGVELDLVSRFPDDGRSGEFDNVGDALNLSMVQLQQYLAAADLALGAAIEKSVEAPETKTISASYKGSREGDKFIGKVWKELPDGSIVRFNDGGYPTGMMRSSNVRERGRYRVKITGYAYQSDTPISFLVGGISFARGASPPTYGYFTFSPGRSQTVEFETVIGRNYMIQIEPYGLHMKQYQREEIDSYEGPGLAIQSVELTGPLRDSFPSRGHQLLFEGLGRKEIEPHHPKEKLKSWYKPKFSLPEDLDAGAALARLAERAFRRPVANGEIADYVALYQDELEGGATREEALRTAAAALLCSPDFLFLREEPGALDQHALASRLSYFLTRTLPDESLLAAAAKRSLSEELGAHTTRLLRGDHFDRFIGDFADAWLDLREIDFTNPDEKLYPEFDRYLKWSMLEESKAFLRHLIEADLPVRNLIKSDFAFLNERLAHHYQIDGVKGAEIRKVSLASDSPRGGVLTQAAVLKVTANGTNTSPVTRGVWVLERLLGIHPQPPPPGIPGVEPDIRGASTLRELLDKHRDSPSCTACHQLIDPPGFALESFDPIGGWRDRFRSLGEGEKVDLQLRNRRVQYRLGQPVDSAGQLPDGRPFSGYLEFRDLLAKDEDALAKALATKLLTFATGREMGFSDRAEIAQIVTESKRRGLGVGGLLSLVIESKIFRTK